MRGDGKILRQQPLAHARGSDEAKTAFGLRQRGPLRGGGALRSRRSLREKMTTDAMVGTDKTVP
jgi:hypothetical protein